MEFNNTVDFFRRINQAYNLILAAPLGIFAFIYLERGAGGWEPIVHDYFYISLINYTLSIFAIIFIVLGFRNFKEKLKELNSHSLKTKLSTYYNAFLNQQLLMTSGSIFAIAGLYLSGNHLFTFIYLFSLFSSSIQRPSSQRVIKVLNLQGEQKDIINMKKSIPN